MLQRLRGFYRHIAATAVLGLLLVALACSGPDVFRGTELISGDPADPFKLINHLGRTVSLSDYRGKTVVLTFLYTSCPNICPITAGHLREAHSLLGADSEGVGIVAISVDPERDTIDRARAFSDSWQMTGVWDFLVGEREELSAIWKAYYIDPAVDDSPSDGQKAASTTSDPAEARGVRGPQEEIAREYLVAHSAPVYLIDRDGIMRVLFTQPFEPEDLAHDIRLLAAR